MMSFERTLAQVASMNWIGPCELVDPFGPGSARPAYPIGFLCAQVDPRSKPLLLCYFGIKPNSDLIPSYGSPFVESDYQKSDGISIKGIGNLD